MKCFQNLISKGTIFRFPDFQFSRISECRRKFLILGSEIRSVSEFRLKLYPAGPIFSGISNMSIFRQFRRSWHIVEATKNRDLHFERERSLLQPILLQPTAAELVHMNWRFYVVWSVS